ncbi:hypothetical protein [Fodinibius sediminis]|uniref:Uncharacterized protein n=1 Tax=Fodinibius sediminis TaxID=1214077 RepID=A0A521EVL1_9BACT|nr:hypothetical protein [Fodinibius sediminis]SMO87954.1 hypothetical protein SAMN06265218_11940 [Fodinibius sediminis]
MIPPFGLTLPKSRNQQAGLVKTQEEFNSSVLITISNADKDLAPAPRQTEILPVGFVALIKEVPGVWGRAGKNYVAQVLMWKSYPRPKSFSHHNILLFPNAFFVYFLAIKNGQE